MTGTGNWSNVTKTINSTVDCIIRWRVYANDTSNNWNTSSIYNYVTTNPSNISGCSVINTPGTVYLTQDINSATSPCINISTTNVTLDCQNHKINSTVLNTYGIYYAPSTSTNSYHSIKNCNLNDWSYGIYFGAVVGYNTYYANYNNFTNITIMANNSANAGIYVHGSYNQMVNISSSHSSRYSSTNGIYIDSGGDGNNQLTNITSNKHRYGIYLYKSNNDRLTNINVNDNLNWVAPIGETFQGYGLDFDSVDSTNVTDLTANDNNYGIVIGSTSSQNQLTNIITNNNEEYGLFILYDSNIISNLTAKNNSYGVYLQGAENNTINNSTIQNNTYGIHLSSAGQTTPNKIYNNLFNNTNNVAFSGTVYNNSWNTTNQTETNIIGGPYIGGNYWTNSTNNGYSDTCTDSNRDGFCDNAYNLTTGTSCTSGVNCGDNVDYFPLSYQYIYLEVTLITPLPNIVTKVVQNSTFNVNATITCRGGSCGTVQGTVRYNASSTSPDTTINTTIGTTPFYIVEALSRPISWQEVNNTGTYQNATYAYDDDFNDTSTYAEIRTYCIDNPCDQDESIEYTWDSIEPNATLFYTWSTSLTNYGSNNIYFWNWQTNQWDSKRGVETEDMAVRNLSINSTYVNSTGGFKVLFYTWSVYALSASASLIQLYDVYISTNISTISCGYLSENQVCNLTWKVNATGNINTYWKIDVNFNSSDSFLTPSDTADAIIKIVSISNLHIQGIALYYYTGERVNGNVTVIPLENPDDKDTSTVVNGEWSSDFYTETNSLEHLTIIVDDAQKIGYNELKLNNPATTIFNCSTQDIFISGYSVDLNSGNSITSGNVKVSILDTDYVNTTTFSGTWSIDFHPCLIPGKTYTLQVLVSDNTGKRGEFLQKYPAR